jgi:hypothetical protein
MKFLPLLFSILFCNSNFAQQINNNTAVEYYTIDKSVIDFGEVMTNDKIEGVFEIKNISTDPLWIESVQPSSGNFIPQYSRSIIGAGKTGIVTVNYPSHDAGVYNKTITIRTTLGVKTVFIKGKIVDYWITDKYNYDVGTIIEKPEGELIDVLITNISNDTLQIEKIVYNAAGCGIWKPNEKIYPHKSEKVTIMINTQGRMGPIHTHAVVKTNKGSKIINFKGQIEKAFK